MNGLHKNLAVGFGVCFLVALYSFFGDVAILKYLASVKQTQNYIRVIEGLKELLRECNERQNATLYIESQHQRAPKKLQEVFPTTTTRRSAIDVSDDELLGETQEEFVKRIEDLHQSRREHLNKACCRTKDCLNLKITANSHDLFCNKYKVRFH